MKKRWILAGIANVSATLATELPALESSALKPINTNVQPGKFFVARPTCLNPEASGGYSLEETLEIIKNCVQGFTRTFRAEVSSLYELGLFRGHIKQYNPEVMSILHRIFTIDPKRPDNIVYDFNRLQKFLLIDMDHLSYLVKEKDSQEATIRELLNQIKEPFLKICWCTNHYLNNYKRFTEDQKFLEK